MRREWSESEKQKRVALIISHRTGRKHGILTFFSLVFNYPYSFNYDGNKNDELKLA